MKGIRRLFAFLLAVALSVAPAYAELVMDQDTEEVPASVFEEDAETAASAGAVSVPAPSAILIEKSTGTVIYEKNADERMEPASVTKVMTVLLIVEAIESGAIKLDDVVTVSQYAASMGGSQVYLEEGEQMSVHDMLKSIVVSSANDAAVAMAEHLCGTEEAFAARMNERAAELGMSNTHFMNCSGLLDQPEHLTTARDISIMSRELIAHDLIKEYTTIWTDTVRGGEFGLSNTNKLIRFYAGATGLKTGFTRRAGYCLSATAERDGVEYIAVVMGCESSTDRFESAKTLLSFAFANYTLVDVTPGEALCPVRVVLGEPGYVQPELSDTTPLLVERSRAADITSVVELDGQVDAPVAEGDELGLLTVFDGDLVLAEVPIVSRNASERLTWGKIFLHTLGGLFF